MNYSKFKRPNLELISSYTIQNPFLLGSFLLRKEHLNMALKEKKTKEKYLYYPLESFDEIEDICRWNIQRRTKKHEHFFTFYANSVDASQASGHRKFYSQINGSLYKLAFYGITLEFNDW